ncbi:MAG: hypothetical protein JRE43_10610 [Deltaproteobacteria bacterium]|nr:hypothetical protein [Deltaproteobacteria bacterium]MBW2542789.1 hypothetical protein [Deltaproteobacteria bacterium]
MEESAYIGGVIVCLGYLIVAARLALLGAKTREMPEQLLAVTFLLWGAAYACWQLPLVSGDDSIFAPLYAAGRLLTDAGTIASAFFLRLVFRPNSRVATGLVAGIAIGLALGVAGSGWVGDWASIDPLGNPWWWVEWSAVTVSVAWIGVEGFHHYGTSKLRRRLGLCSALDCNRYLLWGLSGAIWVVYELVYAIQQIEFKATGVFSASLDAIASLLEVVPIILIWFIFIPPAAYQRWIARSDAHPAAAED